MAFNYQAIITAFNSFANKNNMTSKAHQPNFRGIIDAINGLEEFGNRAKAVVHSSSPGINANDLIYIDSNNKARLAQANSLTTAIVAGVALETGSAGETITYGRNMVVKITNVSNSVDGSPSELTPGAKYYLSYTTAGNYTATPETSTAGAIIAPVGLAISTTEITIEIEKVLKI